MEPVVCVPRSALLERGLLRCRAPDAHCLFFSTKWLVVREADGCVTQQNRSRETFIGRRSKVGRKSCTEFVGLDDRSFGLSSWGKETMQHHNKNMIPKKCLIIHSLKLITGGMILSLRTHNCPARKHVCLFVKTPIQ